MIYTIHGSPMPKERPRVNTKTGTVYTPKKTLQWERDIRKQLVSPVMLKGNVEVILHFFLIEKRHKKIDLDNLIKAVLDALNKVCYKDDKQVTRIDARKIITLSDEQVVIGIDTTIQKGGVNEIAHRTLQDKIKFNVGNFI